MLENQTVYLSHSGGKDSQAMYLFLLSKIPPKLFFIFLKKLSKFP